MYLKRLEIQGFKTFAQRVTFVFPPGITAVVGPNGSGKSNIVDALRWALGEQSFANLRCKRTEDLIYSGGKGRAPMGFADVSLCIDNGDRLLPLPYDEVTIQRRAYRGGENEYFINRARVRLRDLLDAVAPLGSSFTLINQGLVDAALALHPEDRQKLFEDAAEIGPYQAKKSEAERRLRETEANLLRLSDLLQEQEPRARALKRQARDAEAAGAVETELHELLARQYRALVGESLRATAAAGAAEQRQAVELHAARERRAATVEALGRERDNVRERRAHLAALRESGAATDRRIAVNGRERAVARERAAGLRVRQDELREREQALREARAATEAEAQALKAEVERGAATLAEERARFGERSDARRELAGARRAAETSLSEARGELARKTATAGALEARYGQLVAASAALNREVESIERELVQASSALGGARERLTVAESALAAGDSALREAAAALDAAQHALRAAREERERGMEALALARRTHAELETRYGSLARLIHSGEGSFPGVKAALRWATRAGHQDFRLVSSILEVPQALETAIEVALGSRLQQIVVDRWEVAEAAIAELKRTNAGRATFLPLETLRPGKRIRRDAAQFPAGILGCAADMIAHDRRYTPAVDMLLGRTLIAEDLRAARRSLEALEPGWGLVTLAGEQVAASGALSGGSASKEAGTLRREREYRELPRRIADAHAEVERWQTQAAALADTVEARLAGVRAAEVAVGAARAERKRRQGAVEARRRDLHRAEDAYAALVTRAERLGADRSNVDKDLARVAQALASAQAEQTTAKAAVEVAETQLHQAQQHARGEEEALEALRETLLRGEAEHRVRRESFERQQRSLTSVTRELDALVERVARLGGELATVYGELAHIEAEGATLSQAARQLHDQLEPLEADLVAAEARLQTLEPAERAATADVIEREREHADAAIALQHCRAEARLLRERMAADGVDEALIVAVAEETGAAPEAGETGLARRIEQLRGRLQRMGPVNALAPGEYAALVERQTFLQGQLADIRAATSSLRDGIRELDEIMDARFYATFNAVAAEFSASFTRLFGGGSAHLALVGAPENAADEPRPRRGVEIIAQPPGKRQMHLQLLSGGERALTAAALLFAILKHHPRPFCLLDEVDAALDEANVVRFREALLELAEETQFVVVTHNRGTVEAAGTMYGVSMGVDGASRVLSLRLVEETG
jgi:chromosome segregation protein